MFESALLDGLPPEQRLALAYAPKGSRDGFAAFFALDAKLAGIVRSGREPVLAQMRMAWWRERLIANHDRRPGTGEPILAALTRTGADLAPFAALVDGWEALLVAEMLDADTVQAFAAGRRAAILALGLDDLADPAGVAQAVWEWTLADLAARVGSEAERHVVLAIVQGESWRRLPLPRRLRPLAVLHALARRSRGEKPLLAGPADLLTAIRAGLLGT